MLHFGLSTIQFAYLRKSTELRSNADLSSNGDLRVIDASYSFLALGSKLIYKLFLVC